MCTCARPAALLLFCPQTLALNKDTLSNLGSNLGKQPVAFVAVIKLKPGTDVDKFISTREDVAKKAKETYKDVHVAYIKVGFVEERGACVCLPNMPHAPVWWWVAFPTVHAAAVKAIKQCCFPGRSAPPPL